MAEREVYRIEIPIEIADRTEPGLSRARQKFTSFERTVQQSQRRMQQMQRTRWQMVVSAVDRASPVLRGVSSHADRLARSSIRIPIRVLDYATRPLRSILSLLTSTMGMLGLGVGGSAAAYGGVVWPVKLADYLTKARLAFDKMLGSQQAGAAFFKQLQQFAIGTPFKTSDVTAYSQLLLSFQFAARDVIPMIQAIGDAVAAHGGGAGDIEGIARALGQMKLKGRVMAEEINQQLVEHGVQAWDYLARGYGKTVAQVQKMSEAGLLKAETAIPMIIKGMQQDFGGMMQSAANQTVGGFLSQIGDVLELRLGARWGQGIQKAALPALKDLNEWFDANKDTVELWGDELEKAGHAVTTGLIDRLGWLKTTLSGLVRSPEWQNATTLGDKARLVWDAVIVEPFDKWWNSSGQQWVADKAQMLGEGLGSAMGGVISGLLGGPDEGKGGSAFASAGASAGSAFARGFIEGFNAPAVGRALLNALPPPFGQGDLTSGAVAVGGARLALKLTGLGGLLWGGLKLGRRGLGWLSRGRGAAVAGAAAAGGRSLLGWPSRFTFGGRGSGGLQAQVDAMLAAEAAGGASNSAALAAGAPAVVTRVAGGARGGSWLGTLLPGVGRGASALAKRVPLLGLLFAGAEVAAARPEDRLRTIFSMGGGLLGGLGGGALGSLLFPGVGTVAGGIAGGVAGSAAGEWLYGKLFGPQVEQAQQLADASARLEQAFGPDLAQGVVPELTTSFLSLDRTVQDLTRTLRDWKVLARGGAGGPGGPPLNAASPTYPLSALAGGKLPGGSASATAGGDYVQMAHQAALQAGIDPDIFERQIRQESGFNPNALSGAGAQGIAQFMPGTAKGLGINPWDPAQALPAAARYMADRVKAYGGDYALALASYVAGPGNVARYGQRIFDPAYLMADGWKPQDAQAPLQYRRSILGYASGGTLYEPVLGVGLRSGRNYAFGERGVEDVTPRGRGSGGRVIVILESGAVQIVSAVGDPVALAEQIADPVAEAIARRAEETLKNVVPGGRL